MEKAHREPLMACGIESPLAPNGALTEIDEERGELIIATTLHQELRRYSFVWLGPFGEGDAQLGVWLERIVSAHESAWWVGAWSSDTKLGIKGALLERKLAREGATFSRGDFRVAVWPATNWENWNSLGIGGTVFVVTGSRPDPEELAARFVIPIWRQVLDADRMAPSRQLLDWLAATRRGLIYRRTDHVGHAGLVVIATRPVDTTLVVGETTPAVTMRGTAAQKVWLEFH